MKNANEELIEYIKTLTEEQVKKVFDHPVFKALMEKQKTLESAFREVVDE